MARTTRQPFSPTGDYIALKDFRFAGRNFKRSKPFPWRKLSCSTRKLLQLWEGRFIDIKGDDLPSEEVNEEEVTEEVEVEEETQDETNTQEEAETEETEEETEEPEEVEEDEAEEETEEAEDSNAFVFDPELHRVVNSKKKGLCIKEGKKFIMTIDKGLAKQLREATEPVEIELG